MTISIFMDAQFGSCGKGAIVSALSQIHRPKYVVRVGGPQAGHSMLGPCPRLCSVVHEERPKKSGGVRVFAESLPFEHVWKMRQVPSAWHSGAICVIGRGAMVDLDVLKWEIEHIYHEWPNLLPLIVDQNAFIVTAEDRDSEMHLGMDAGSTFEGVGAARASAIMRKATTVHEALNNPEIARWLKRYVYMDTAAILRSAVGDGANVWIEATQGFGLSLRASGFYPHVTSHDITPQQLLADVGLHWEDARIHTYMLVRTYPIRIAGLNSGPLDEIGWDEIEVPPPAPETTTVTGKERRIGKFDMEQVLQAVEECRPNSLIVTFADYLHAGSREKFIYDLETSTGVNVSHVSEGFERVWAR